ncbi:hypothetical protein K461DRAFT_327229 [Myriangium duriaei CBS 260.36]|uniref:T6SS Phospholipase effector Tle1-like catalytic domain-containing protein n=1 Tax=Myriangium duriaei CBS 260.36 TaxID=1168546 RepID=A0A9P4MLC4_9PEZI|nr:hypothetical protein K461DRAFT_327229 [Myriangium duriaei CBS 260.36]
MSTWLDADTGVKHSQPPSNVTRLSRAIHPQTSDGTKQIVYYSRGVGSTGGFADRLYGGLSGEGVAENIRAAYAFLSTNYRRGDEIFLFGFSRGAFTARAIAGLIAQVGVLTRSGQDYLAEIYADVRHRHDEDYKPAQPNKPFRNKPPASDPRYRAELAHRGLTTLGVHVKAVGVWDTVGALGTPRIGWLEKVGLQSSVSKHQLEFYDTKLSPVIENAFQALALDERRASFSPAVWELEPRNTTTRLRQVWFPGVHANIGGGYPDQALANITLAWMASQVAPMLDLDLDHILDEQDATDAYYEKDNQRPRPWSFGKIYNSIKGVWMAGGASTRTPGRYMRVSPKSAAPTDSPLRNTHEYIHASVRARWKLGGPGYDDMRKYEARALKDWRLLVDPPEAGERGPDVVWELDTEQKNVSTRELPEAPLWPLERELLQMAASEEMEDYVLRPPLDGEPMRRKRGKGKLKK